MSGITVTTHRSVSHHLIYQYLPAGREIANPTQSVLAHKLLLVRSSVFTEPVRAGIAALYEHHQDRLPDHHLGPPFLHHQVTEYSQEKTIYRDFWYHKKQLWKIYFFPCESHNNNIFKIMSEWQIKYLKL